jgi:hypothetical protein
MVLVAGLTGVLASACSDDDRFGGEQCSVCEQGRPDEADPLDGSSAAVSSAENDSDGGFVEEADADDGSDASDSGGEPCCYGDGIRQLTPAGGAEVVDLEQQGEYSITCGGFGARIDHLGPDLSIETTLSAGARCQNIAFGPKDDAGQVFYLAHHGDGWVASPSLSVWRVGGHAGVSLIDEVKDRNRLFEGIEWRDGRLYATLHEQGVQVFETGSNGEGLQLMGATSFPFSNAIEIALDDAGEFAFVADGAGGVRVLSLTETPPESYLQVAATIETGGLARHVEWADGRLYTALGGGGVIVHDVGEPLAALEVGRIETRGSAQQVAIDGDLLAIAAWSHLALHDAQTLELLGTERVRQWAESEQDLAVDIAGTNIFLGEWNHSYVLEYESGLAAPDLWLNESVFDFQPGVAEARAVVVENRGTRPLIVGEVSTSAPDSFTVDVDTPVTIEAGSKFAFELGFSPPAPSSGEAHLIIESDDPDADNGLGGYRSRLLVRETAGIDVGDPLGDEFGFLDVSGELGALEGDVLVLAYFALF